jgi:hypothetical protein
MHTLEEFYLSTDGSDVLGPYSRKQIQELISKGRIPLTSSVCVVGTEDWQPASSIVSVGTTPPVLPQTAGGKSNALTAEDRTEILEAYIEKYLQTGYRITNRTPTTAQFVKPKQFSAGLAVICLILAVFPFIIYLLIYMGEKDKVAYVSVGYDGKVTQTPGTRRVVPAAA